MKFEPFLRGRISIAQPETGHRAGTDAILLAATVSSGFSGLVVDAGAGVGGAGLALAARVPDARVNLVEIDPATVEFARANSAHNALETRLSVVEADLLASHAERSLNGLTREDAACVITNPPFLSEGEARPSSDEDRRRAHLMPTGGLERWMKAIHALLAPRGNFVMITRPERLQEIIVACEGRFGFLTLLPIHPHEGDPAIRLLIRGTKGSKAPLSILPGLVLHGPDGRFTPFVEKLHAGEASLNLV